MLERIFQKIWKVLEHTEEIAACLKDYPRITAFRNSCYLKNIYSINGMFSVKKWMKQKEYDKIKAVASVMAGFNTLEEVDAAVDRNRERL